MKHIVRFFLAVLFNGIVGAILASLLGFSPLSGALVANGIAVLMAQMPQMQGVLREGVLTEVWTGELIKKLRGGTEATFLDGISDQSALANNDVIHLVDVGVDPDVLINQTSYPIDIQDLPDGDKAIKLDKFVTKVTPITDDELYATSYDKMQRVKESHGNAINDAKNRKAAHALTPLKNTATTPVLKTSGAWTGEDDKGRRRLRMEDIVAIKEAMDKLGVPSGERRLVLCHDHVNDLLLIDQKFKEQYYNYATGKIANLYGFEVYEYGSCPYFTANGQKKALDAEVQTGEYQASFAFYKPRVFKATGSTKMYYSSAATDPLNQRNLINFRHYFIALPKKDDASVAIYSEYKA